jgi:RsmE family RNA methyltransferase
MDLEQFLGRVSKDSCLIYFALDEEIPPLGVVLDSRNPGQATFVIGPEGGLTFQEEARLAVAGFVPASLGPTTLRTETAAIVAVGIIMGWGLAHTQGSV